MFSGSPKNRENGKIHLTDGVNCASFRSEVNNVSAVAVSTAHGMGGGSPRVGHCDVSEERLSQIRGG